MIAGQFIAGIGVPGILELHDGKFNVVFTSRFYLMGNVPVDGSGGPGLKVRQREVRFLDTAPVLTENRLADKAVKGGLSKVNV